MDYQTKLYHRTVLLPEGTGIPKDISAYLPDIEDSDFPPGCEVTFGVWVRVHNDPHNPRQFASALIHENCKSTPQSQFQSPCLQLLRQLNHGRATVSSKTREISACSCWSLVTGQAIVDIVDI